MSTVDTAQLMEWREEGDCGFTEMLHNQSQPNRYNYIHRPACLSRFLETWYFDHNERFSSLG